LKIFQWTVGTIIIPVAVVLIQTLRAKFAKDKAVFTFKIKSNQVVIAKIDIFPKIIIEGYTLKG
jgi:hypothetical protein